MAIQRIQPGTRIGADDPLCAIKTEEVLLNHEYDAKEPMNGEGGKWFERRTKSVLLSHCVDKDPERGQQDDGRTSEVWPVRDDAPPKPRHGGPTWTDKKHL